MHDFKLCYIKKFVNKSNNEHMIWRRNEKYKEAIVAVFIYIYIYISSVTTELFMIKMGVENVI